MDLAFCPISAVTTADRSYLVSTIRWTLVEGVSRKSLACYATAKIYGDTP